ncbi:PQQ-binding-like beta-propeller repeat protein [Actinophytocola glycyrrhizae]|uniref:PQQ-binding-like beta-propeller repeat protein n=1 Tax=Actinophytocola glycyrrhizae TaxID=2044873 RepID=A0ABV9RTR9_9PSEU
MTDPIDPPAGGASSTEPAARPANADRAAEVDSAPARPDVLATLRGRRPLVLAAAAVLLVAAVVTTLLVTLGDADRPVPPGTMPTLGSQFAAPPTGQDTSTPAVPAPLPSFRGNPLWTLPLPPGSDEHDVPEFAVTDHGYVLVNDKDVVGLDRAGTELWRFAPPATDYFRAEVTGSQVFLGYRNPDEDRWPQPEVIVALDAATGAELWRETEASFWSVTTDTIYLSVCYGGQNNHIGDCELSARDPRTNSIRWAIPTYASSRVVNDSQEPQAAPTPPYLLIGSYPTGRESYVLSSHDPGTGATLGSGFRGPDGDIGSVSTASERMVVTTEDHDDNPADGCTATLIGFSVAGADEIWRHTARTAKELDGKRCGRQPVSRNRGRMAVTTENGAPSVLNVETGAIEWSAPQKGQALAASDTTLLVAESAAEGTVELVAYRVGNAKPVWRAPFPGNVDAALVTITDTHAVVTRTDAAGYDLKTGEGWSYGGVPAQDTATWFAVCDATACRAYPVG